MESVTVKVLDNGPIMISGPAQLLDGEGNAYNAGSDGTLYLCRCGHSNRKPFCDGSHQGRLDHCFRAAALL